MEGKTIQGWVVEDVPRDGLTVANKTEYGSVSRTSCLLHATVWDGLLGGLSGGDGQELL